MSRHRYNFPLAFALLLTVTSCVRAFHTAPITQAAPNYKLVQTAVVQTLTAYPTPSLPATLTPASTLSRQDPSEFIYLYFDAINSRNYTLTWSLLGDRYKDNVNGPAQGGYQGYVDFWNSIKQVTVENVNYFFQNDRCIADVTLQLVPNNGQANTSTYRYTLTYDSARNTWLFDFIP